MIQRAILIISILSACTANKATAQHFGPSGEAVVSGSGSVEIRRMPTVLRVHIEIPAKGKDLKEALDKLKARRDALPAVLAKLGAEQIKFGDPAGGGPKSPQQMQMELMYSQRLRLGAKEGPKAKVNVPVEASVSLRFEVPLKAATVEELLLKGDALQTQIQNADLGGLKEFQKLSPQEEEIAEEMQGLQMRHGGGEEVKKGEPVFLYIGKVDADEVNKAMANAFKDAAKQAQNLAQAAGAGLGDLVYLHNPGASEDGPNWERQMMYQRYGQRGGMIANDLVGAREASSQSAGPVTYRVQIVAGFRLKK